MLSQYLCSFHLQNDVERKQLYKKKRYISETIRPIFFAWVRLMGPLCLWQCLQSDEMFHVTLFCTTPCVPVSFQSKILQLEKEDFTYYSKPSACVWHINLKCTALNGMQASCQNLGRSSLSLSSAFISDSHLESTRRQ